MLIQDVPLESTSLWKLQPPRRKHPSAPRSSSNLYGMRKPHWPPPRTHERQEVRNLSVC